MAQDPSVRGKRREVEEVPLWHRVMLPLAEMAALMSISESQLRELHYQQGFPVVKLGPKCWRVYRPAADEWLRTRPQFWNGGDQ